VLYIPSVGITEPPFSDNNTSSTMSPLLSDTETYFLPCYRTNTDDGGGACSPYLLLALENQI
jgi:hypothetical protein